MTKVYFLYNNNEAKTVARQF